MTGYPKYLPALANGKKQKGAEILTDKDNNLLGYSKNGKTIKVSAPSTETTTAPSSLVQPSPEPPPDLDTLETKPKGDVEWFARPEPDPAAPVHGATFWEVSEDEMQRRVEAGEITERQYAQYASAQAPIRGSSFEDFKERVRVASEQGDISYGKTPLSGVPWGEVKTALPETVKGAWDAFEEGSAANRRIGRWIEGQVPGLTEAREAFGRALQAPYEYMEDKDFGRAPDWAPDWMKSRLLSPFGLLDIVGGYIEEEPLLTPLDIAFFGMPVAKLGTRGVSKVVDPLLVKATGKGFGKTIQKPMGMLPDVWGGSSIATDTFGMKKILPGSGFVADLFNISLRESGNIIPHLSAKQVALNMAKRSVGRWVTLREADPVANAAMKERVRLRDVLASRSNLDGIRSKNIIDKAFKEVLDDSGRITTDSFKGVVSTIPGAPTLADVAAHLPLYRQHLTSAQLDALTQVRTILTPYRKGLDDVGHTIIERPDVIEGGFYIPRGGAELEGFDIGVNFMEVAATTTKYGKAKKGFEHTIKFPSQSQGIDEKMKYLPAWASIGKYTQDIGDLIIDLHVSHYLKNITDDAGNFVASTAYDRVPPALRDRITKLRQKMAGLRKTKENQAVRGAAQERELDRASKFADDARKRDLRASERGNPALEGYARSDLVQARKLREQAISDAKWIVGSVEKNSVLLGQAKSKLALAYKKLSGKSAALDKKLNQLKKLETRKRDRQGRFRGRTAYQIERMAKVKKDIIDIGKQSEKITAQTIKYENKIDDLILEGKLLKGLNENARNILVETRKAERSQIHQQMTIGILERELFLLKAETRRADRFAERAAGRSIKTSAREDKTAKYLKEVNEEYAEINKMWKVAVEDARKTPIGYGVIGKMRGVEGYSFPDAISHHVNKILEAEGPATGRFGNLINTVENYNNMYRGLSATADLSAVGIQGVLAMADDPTAWSQAFKLSIQAWGKGGDDILGPFIASYDDIAKMTGRMNSTNWVTEGLRIGGTKTEFELGAGISEAISNLPVVRQANRAFGFFGDALRLGWADDMLEAELRSGRTLDDIIRSGDARRIADVTNNMTGWASGKAFGSMGDLLLFAPRFLQSRLETVAKAGMSLRPGANIDQRTARRSLLKMVGYGTVLTVAANEMLGNETDFEPLKNGKYNANFMRIRFGGRDWSLFGTWDSLARAMVSTAQGDVLGSVRSMGSGVVQNGWDLIANEDFTRDPVRDDPVDFAAWIIKSHSPFATQELPSIIGQYADDEWGVASVTLIGEIFGGKSSPLSFTDRLNILSQETKGVDFDKLSPTTQRIIKRRVQKQDEEAREKREMHLLSRESQRRLGTRYAPKVVPQDGEDRPAGTKGVLSEEEWLQQYRAVGY